VQSAIEYLRDILQIVNRYVTTFAQIAAGNIAPGAQMLEQGLAAAIPIAIGFLANQVGLGNVPEKIVELIQRLRELVDQGLNWLSGEGVGLGQGGVKAVGLGPNGQQQPGHQPTALPAIDERFNMLEHPHHVYVGTRGGRLVLMMASADPDVAIRKIDIALRN